VFGTRRAGLVAPRAGGSPAACAMLRRSLWAASSGSHIGGLRACAAQDRGLAASCWRALVLRPVPLGERQGCARWCSAHAARGQWPRARGVARLRVPCCAAPYGRRLPARTLVACAPAPRKTVVWRRPIGVVSGLRPVLVGAITVSVWRMPLAALQPRRCGLVPKSGAARCARRPPRSAPPTPRLCRRGSRLGCTLRGSCG